MGVEEVLAVDRGLEGVVVERKGQASRVRLSSCPSGLSLSPVKRQVRGRRRRGASERMKGGRRYLTEMVQVLFRPSEFNGLTREIADTFIALGRA